MYWQRRLVFAVGLLFSNSAWAADKPELAPPASWIKPLTAPPLTSAQEQDGSALHLLLSDAQVSFDGHTTRTFISTAMRAQKPEALAALGTFALAWKPDTDRVTVHWLRIRRAGQLIDILGQEQFTVLRREQNLERAALDGILTATLSIAGLQVGDVLESAWTVERTDPLLNGHHDMMLEAGTGGNISRLGRSVQWGRDSRVVVKTHNLPTGAVMGPSSISFTTGANAPLVLPQGAPLRFRMGRMIELSDFPDWATVSATFAPLYATARKLEPSSPLQAEIARIKAASADPVDQAGRALRLVEDSVRYLYVGLNDSNLRPTAADETWRRRFGDCKAKTALLLALLDGLGIPAEAALVSTGLGDGMDTRLPNASQFDHVIVRAEVAGKIYWLDGTRLGDKRIVDLDVPDFSWALPLKTAQGALERLVVQSKTAPNSIYELHLDASQGVMAPATAHAEATFSGDAGNSLHIALTAIAASARDQQLRDFWTRQYDFITPAKVAQNWDEATRTYRLTMDGVAQMAWNDAGTPWRRYILDGVNVGWSPDYRREPGPNSDAPFTVDYPNYAEYRETVLLPNKGFGFSIAGNNVDTELAGVAIYRQTELSGNRVTMTARQRPIKREISVAEAETANDALRALADGTVNILVNFNRYQLTAADAQALLANRADNSESGFKLRLAAHLAQDDTKTGLAEAQRFATAFPKSADALEARAVFSAASGMDDVAKTDAAAALAIAPTSVNAKLVSAYYEMASQPPAAGEERPPFLIWRHSMMAEACRRDRDFGCARDNIEAALKIDPKSSMLYVALANMYRAEGRRADAAAIADRMVAFAPKDADMLAVAGVVYCSTGQCQKGLAAFARSIAAKPNITAYLNRIRYMPQSDLIARKRDIDAALALDPASLDALDAMAQWQKTAGDREGEVKTLQSLAARITAKEEASQGRAFRLGSIYARAGDAAKARENFAEFRGFAAATKNGGAFNSLCYTAAAINFDLDTALADCKRAVDLEPKNPAIIDSLAFVHFRLGHFAEAIAAYDRAIAIAPNIAPSLYVRGLAYIRQGEKAKGEADIAAATRADPNVAEAFRTMGVQ